MAEREKKKVVSRKHLARVEREQIQRRYITIISVTIFAAVIVVIGIGFIIGRNVIKPRQPIATVNDNNDHDQGISIFRTVPTLQAGNRIP